MIRSPAGTAGWPSTRECDRFGRVRWLSSADAIKDAVSRVLTPSFLVPSHEVAAREGPEFYLCATCVFGSGTSCTRLSVAQEPAAQVIGVSNFVGTRFGPSVDREIIGQLPSGF
jgi:hypothetical protein